MGIVTFCRHNAVLVISILAALVTAIIVPPDAAYLGYYDLRTLTCLFCVLAVVRAFSNIRLFYILGYGTDSRGDSAKNCFGNIGIHLDFPVDPVVI